MKKCQNCPYKFNRETALFCGHCGKALDPLSNKVEGIVMSDPQKNTLVSQGNHIGTDLSNLYDSLLDAADVFEGQNTLWRFGGRHVKAYELRQKIRELQSEIDDEVLLNYKSLVAARIQERIQSQIVLHKENVIRQEQKAKIETEGEKYKLEIVMILDVLETLNESVDALPNVNEDIKQQFIEDYFTRLLKRISSNEDQGSIQK